MDEFLAAIGGMRAASGQAAPFEGAGQQGHAGAADDQLPGDDVPGAARRPFGNFPLTYDRAIATLEAAGHGVSAGYINQSATAHPVTPRSVYSQRAVLRTAGERHTMFRQVVAIRWADGVSPEAKQGYRDALDALRAIPELLALTCG